MKTRTPILRIGCLAAICLASGCATEKNKPGGIASCCATNLEPAAALTGKSVYQIGSTWTTDTGQPIKLAALCGRPQVVAMFFTRCQNACPITVTDMKRIEAALPEELRSRVGFTLVSFDPERDKPEDLHKYRQKRSLDQTRWTLLRGESADVVGLAARLGMKYRNGARGQFGHSNLITILNPGGEIVHQQIGLNQSIDETLNIIRQIAVQ